MVKQKLLCYCENRFEADLPDSVDVEKSIEEDILQGTFLSVKCPACGKLIKPEFPVYLINREKDLDLFFIPELDRFTYYRGSLSYPVREAKRVVIGYEELVEKIRLLRHNLDDRVTELVKYYLLNKALQDPGTEQALRIYFHDLEGDTLIFHAVGLKKEEVGVLKVEIGMFEKARVQLAEKGAEEPLASILAGPYVSINRLFSEVGD